MQVTTSPAGRFGWQGQTLEYVVKAEGATELALPKEPCPGVEAKLTNVVRTPSGVEGRIRLDVRDGSFN